MLSGIWPSTFASAFFALIELKTEKMFQTGATSSEAFPLLKPTTQCFVLLPFAWLETDFNSTFTKSLNTEWQIDQFDLVRISCFLSEEQEQDEKPPGSQEKANGPDDKVRDKFAWNGFTQTNWFTWNAFGWSSSKITFQVNIADKIRAKMENVKENVSIFF